MRQAARWPRIAFDLERRKRGISDAASPSADRPEADKDKPELAFIAQTAAKLKARREPEIVAANA
jgi:hypothetical protein